MNKLVILILFLFSGLSENFSYGYSSNYMRADHVNSGVLGRTSYVDRLKCETKSGKKCAAILSCGDKSDCSGKLKKLNCQKAYINAQYDLVYCLD